MIVSTRRQKIEWLMARSRQWDGIYLADRESHDHRLDWARPPSCCPMCGSRRRTSERSQLLAAKRAWAYQSSAAAGLIHTRQLVAATTPGI